MYVLSYNISWEAMTNSSSGSAGKLGRKCLNNICMNNVTTYINFVNRRVNFLDFIAFQEMAKFKELSSKIDQFSEKYNYILSTSKPEIMVTCYRKNMNLIEKYCGNFKKGRPFHILYLKHQNKKIIFINLHYCNNYDKCNLQMSLTRALQKMTKIKNINSCRVVIAGDFNFNRWKNHPESFQVNYDNSRNLRFRPFKNINIETGCSFPKKTCCSDEDQDGKKMYNIGDFILDSEYKNIKNEIFYPNRIKGLSSDHYPVFSFLKK